MWDWIVNSWDSIWNWGASLLDWMSLDAVGATLAWIVTGCLLLVGLVGCLIPVLPGHLIVLLAAGVHHLMLRGDSGVEWWTYAVLGTLLVIAQVLEFMSGAAGNKWFGGTRWGSVGALCGGIVGMFFFPLGLILGPLIGSFGFEFLFAERTVRDSTKSGVGAVFGAVTGMVIKAIIGAVMILWFIIDVIWI